MRSSLSHLGIGFFLQWQWTVCDQVNFTRLPYYNNSNWCFCYGMVVNALNNPAFNLFGNACISSPRPVWVYADNPPSLAYPPDCMMALLRQCTLYQWDYCSPLYYGVRMQSSFDLCSHLLLRIIIIKDRLWGVSKCQRSSSCCLIHFSPQDSEFTHNEPHTWDMVFDVPPKSRHGMQTILDNKLLASSARCKPTTWGLQG